MHPHHDFGYLKTARFSERRRKTRRAACGACGAVAAHAQDTHVLSGDHILQGSAVLVGPPR